MEWTAAPSAKRLVRYVEKGLHGLPVTAKLISTGKGHVCSCGCKEHGCCCSMVLKSPHMCLTWPLLLFWITIWYCWFFSASPPQARTGCPTPKANRCQSLSTGKLRFEAWRAWVVRVILVLVLKPENSGSYVIFNIRYPIYTGPFHIDIDWHRPNPWNNHCLSSLSKYVAM